MTRWKSASLALVGLFVLEGSAAQAEGEILAVATFSILGDFVSKVGGDRVSVRTIVGPGGDAHVYQPTPADAAAIAKANIVFENGLGFEGWMERLSKASDYKGPVIVATKGIEPLHSGGEHHAEGNHDPHAWQSVSNAMIYIANVKDGLCQVDAGGCDLYTRNAEAYTAELVKLDDEIREQIGSVPEKSRKVITSHDAFAYFSKAYGVTFLAPTGVSTESEASAKDVADIIDQVRKGEIKALFVENITDPRLIAQIANETGATLGGTLYSDALSKIGGPAATYIDMMRHNARLLAGAMVGS